MKFKNWFRLILGLTILIFIYYKVGIKNLINTFSSINGYYLIPIIFLSIISILLGVINIKLLIIPTKKHVPFWKLTKYYMISWSLGLFSPGKIGEFSISYFLKKYGIFIGEGIALSLVDKFLTLICLFVISLGGVFIFFTNSQALWIIFTFIIFCIAGIFSILSKKIRKVLQKFIPKKISKELKGFSKLLFIYINKHKNLLLINLLLSFIKWLIVFLAIYYLFISFNLKVSFLMIIAIISISKIISLVPITISGLGVREGIAIYLFNKIGVNISIVLSVFLTLLIINYLTALITLLIIKKEDII